MIVYNHDHFLKEMVVFLKETVAIAVFNDFSLLLIKYILKHTFCCFVCKKDYLYPELQFVCLGNDPFQPGILPD